MTEPKAKAVDDMRMSAGEFDRIMGKALQVKPETAKKAKARKSKARKAKAGR